LHRRGFWRGRVEARVVLGDPRVLSYTVTPGRALRVDARFPGVYEVSAQDVEKAAGGAGAFLTDPTRARAAVADFYRRRHYLAARVEEPRIEEDEEGVTMVVPIDEGARARLAGITFEGASQPADQLRNVMALPPGSPWDEGALTGALDQLRAHYFALGHAEVRLEARARSVPPDVFLVVKVAEGQGRTVGAISITGLTRMSAARVQSRLGLTTGQPLDPRVVARAELKLLSQPGISGAVATVGEGNPAPITFAITESERALARYQLSHSSEEGNDVRLDGELGNLLGRGATLGGRYRLGADLRETRAFFRLPIGRGDLTLVGALEDADLEAGASAPEGAQNLRRQTEVQLRYGVPVGNALRFEGGYRFRRVEVKGELEAVVDLGGFDLSTVHDTRDSVFDARRGHLVSLSSHLAPRGLRSDFTFGRALLQVSLARPLRGLTWAQGFRLGLGRGFGGQQVRSTERFFAGGGNSVRGFDTEHLGPLDRQGDPLGGEAMLVVNQELRYRHPWGLGGVVFYDAGNVFPEAKDLSLKLRHSLGVGLRWQSPVGLVRVDVGFPLRRQPHEKGYRLFYSLGQAF
jgi:outer membrane protein assembly factor BamA